jgi:signal transduction histidine kinase
MPLLMLDPQRLRQIAFNLVGNAVKFTARGHIEIRASFNAPDPSQRVGTFRLEVEDTGCGISQEAQPFIFDRFTKGDEFSKGLGLGLAYCYETAQKLGGGLKHDTGYTHGARFIITLPLSCS